MSARKSDVESASLDFFFLFYSFSRYHLAEKVDGQLKRMSEDIKKIIEHLNTASHEDENEPMQQISKILNAHMDALQWIDHNTGQLHKKMDDVTKMLETTRKDQEKAFKIGYD